MLKAPVNIMPPPNYYDPIAVAYFWEPRIDPHPKPTPEAKEYFARTFPISCRRGMSDEEFNAFLEVHRYVHMAEIVAYQRARGLRPVEEGDTQLTEIQPINYEPRGDRVIVRRLPPPESKEGEVYIPASQQKPLDEGIVIAVGPGSRNRLTGQIDPINLEPGDHVCFGDFAGNDVEVDGETYLSMRDEEIHGKRI